MRRAILEHSDPKNFPKSRYQLPPPIGARAEEATDCSHFVHEIYDRVGLSYEYQSTQTLGCLTLFQKTEEAPQAGDLILYRGHVGIYDGDDHVISATRGGRPPKERSTLDPSHPDFVSAITRYPVDTFGKWQALRWRCR